MRLWFFILSTLLIGSLQVNAAQYSFQGQILTISGDIRANETEFFNEALKHEGIEIIALKSRGGDVYSAMRMANLIRANGLKTRIVGECFSACALIFLGGKKRTIDSGRIGFHRVLDVDTGEPIALDHPLYNRLTIFAWGKGVDPIQFVQWMTFANPEGIYFPDDAALCDAVILKPCRD